MTAAVISLMHASLEPPPAGAPGAAVPTETASERLGSDPDLWLYRDRTLGLLTRYMRVSVEVGRLPSLLGREFFRTRVTSYTVATFENAVIFVHDVDRSLEQLDEFEQMLVARIALQAYSYEETAQILGCTWRTVARRFPETLDRLTEIFLQGEILDRLPDTNPAVPKSCQEGKTPEI
jgi:DNA-directed RNA polymerase specialized sigma24 family protein